MPRRASTAYNLASLYPARAREWSPRNARPPSAFTPMSAVKVWWLCARGHEWRTRVADRAQGSSCPYCAGQRPTPEHNLTLVYPALAKEWSPRNQILAHESSPSSGAKVWWLCTNGHEWQAGVNSRARGSGCPYCAGHLPTQVRNLAVLYPSLLPEWSSRNPKPATEYTPMSAVKAWWLCPQGHEWQSVIHNRTKGSGYPLWIAT